MQEAVDVANANGAHISIVLEDTANFVGRYLRIVDGELADEAFDVFDMVGSRVEVSLDNVGNVDCETVYILEGELVGNGLL